MIQKEVYKWFKLYFPQYAEHVEVWFPNGKNSVRVRQTNGQEFIFSYNSPKDWRLETIDCFLKNMKFRKENG